MMPADADADAELAAWTDVAVAVVVSRRCHSL